MRGGEVCCPQGVYWPSGGVTFIRVVRFALPRPAVPAGFRNPQSSSQINRSGWVRGLVACDCGPSGGIAMRKRTVSGASAVAEAAASSWLALAPLAQVEVSSEAPDFAIEAALEPGHAQGWRAAGPGVQTIRLHFDAPTRLRRVWLRFQEDTIARTQELVLKWSGSGHWFREIVRQQWTFSPAGATTETEDYRIELEGVTVLELTIVPDISGGPAHASLAEWRLA